MSQATDARVSLLPILGVTFVGTLGFSIVLPFLVFLVTRLGGNAVVYGVIGATYSAFQLVGAPLLGRWSDRVGRKRILFLSQLGTLASWGLFLVALALPVEPLRAVDAPVVGSFTLTLPLLVLFVARALDGATGGNVSVANAYVADITTPEERAKHFGRMAVAANLGFVLGPALAGVLGSVTPGEWAPVLAAFAISTVALGLIGFTLRESRPRALQAKPERPSVRDVLGGDPKECYRLQCAGKPSTRVLLTMPAVGLLLALQCMVFLAFNFYYVAFPVHAATRLDWSLAEVGVYFAVMGLAMALVQGPLLGRLSRRLSERALVVGGSGLLAVGFALFMSTRGAVIYAGTLLLALGNGIMWPSLLAVLSKSTRPELQGAVQGLGGSGTALASIAGLLLGGVLYQDLGAGVFGIAAGVTGLVALLGLGIGRARPGPTGSPAPLDFGSTSV